MFAKDYGRTFIASLLQGVVTVLLPLLFGWVWNKDVFGFFCYILVIVGLIQIIVDYGFSLQTVKSLSDQSVGNISSVFLKQLNTKNIITFFVLFCLCIYIFITRKVYAQHTVMIFWLFMLAMIAYSYSMFFVFPFQGLKDFKHANKMTVYSNLIFLFCVLPALLFKEPSLSLVAALFLLGRIGGLCFNIFFARAMLKLPYTLKPNFTSETWNTLIQGFPYALLFFLGTFYFQADSFFVEHYLGYSAVATYQLGVRLVILVGFATAVFNMVALPYFNQIDKSQLYQFKQISINLLTFYGGLMGICMMAFSKEIALSFGKNFSDLSQYMPFFGLLVLVRNFGNGYSLLMIITNYQKFRAWVLFIACLMVLVSNFILVPSLHIWGALLSALLVLIFINSCYQTFVWINLKKFFISPKILGIFSYYLVLSLIFYQFPSLFTRGAFIFPILYAIIFLKKKDVMQILQLS